MSTLSLCLVIQNKAQDKERDIHFHNSTENKNILYFFTEPDFFFPLSIVIAIHHLSTFTAQALLHCDTAWTCLFG